MTVFTSGEIACNFIAFSGKGFYDPGFRRADGAKASGFGFVVFAFFEADELAGLDETG